MCLLVLFPVVLPASPQENTDSAAVDRSRLAGVIAVQAGLYAASVTGLYFAWYSSYPQSRFHFFDDSDEWKQVDKCGHAISSWYIGRIGYESYRWAGVGETPAIWYGTMLGFGYLLTVEMFDGFSSGWGFSATDMAANTIGSALFAGQQLLWHQQRVSLKYSFHQTAYAAYRPELLGSNLIQQMVKDYNGHSYWLSVNPSSFAAPESKFPAWLNIAVGYGASGMTGGHAHPAGNAETGYRRFFLSPDIDLTRIRTRSSFLKSVFTVLSFIKIPAPALEFNSKGVLIFHPLYY